jgi:hypothetical protein
VRFVPFAQLALCLLAGATLGLALEHVRGNGLAALGLVLLGLLYGDARSQVLRHWIDWNYTGLEAKELWPAFRRLGDALAGGVADPRVAVEYSAEHERAGSIRMYETLPFFTGRSTLEGVYNQASLTTHAVYYLASELGATSPNPFREIDYARFDPEAALDHLRLFNVSEVVALSPQLTSALQGREDVTLVDQIPPYSLFQRRAEAPRRARARRAGIPRRWRQGLAGSPDGRPKHLVFTDDPGVGGAPGAIRRKRRSKRRPRSAPAAPPPAGRSPGTRAAARRPDLPAAPALMLICPADIGRARETADRAGLTLSGARGGGRGRLRHGLEATRPCGGSCPSRPRCRLGRDGRGGSTFRPSGRRGGDSALCRPGPGPPPGPRPLGGARA